MSLQTKKNLFITVEGIEGVGKSTAVLFIGEYLKKHNIQVKVTREPGGTSISEEIRQVLLKSHTDPMSHETELLLMFASRAQHLAQVIRPALQEGSWVLSDRFTDATYAYQGGGRGIPVERIAALEQWLQGDLRPDVTFLLDAPLELAMQRAKKRSSPDRIESETHLFFQRIKDCYLQRAKQFPERFKVIDASLSLEEVQKQLLKELEKLVF
ncbi:MAG: dTMP kinase [Proteobacteria bacterium]|nr:dTMP kinase [Pseudomonadota bacterium]